MSTVSSTSDRTGVRQASKRSGSANRKRRHQVGVRLTTEELALLRAEAQRQGVSPAEVLRRAFLPKLPEVTAPGLVISCSMCGGTSSVHRYDCPSYRVYPTRPIGLAFADVRVSNSSDPWGKR